MDFALGGRLSILSQRLDLGFDEFAESAIFETFNDRPCAQIRHVEHASARYHTSGLIHFAKQRSFFDRWQTQRQRANRCAA